MLKKKNIAMVMAAATVATSVAPVFALESQSVEEAALLKEVGEKLAVKYTATPEISVYEVKATIQGSTAVPVTKVSELEKLIEKAKLSNNQLTVEIVDKGHNTVEGKVVDTTQGSAYTGAELYAIKENAAIEKVEKFKADGATATSATDVEKVVITLKNKTEIVVNKETARLDLTKGLDASNKGIEITKIASDDTETGKRVVGFEIDKTYSAEELNNITAAGAIKQVDKFQVDGTTPATDASDIDQVKVTLSDSASTVLKLDLNSDRLDFSKGLDVNGNSTTKTDDIVNFEKDTTSKANLPAKNISKLVLNGAVAKNLQFKLEDLNTELGYTETGKELVELLGKANSATSTTPVVNTTDVVKDGKRYDINFNQSKDLKIEAVKDAGYKLTVSLRVAEKGKTLPTSPNVEIVITSAAQKDLVDFENAIKGATNSTVISTAKYNKLAGDNRFETAVEISKAGYRDSDDTSTQNKSNAEAIVLVGENAVVDGLASAPLAKKAKAPILLTQKNTVPTETMKEIKRIVKKGNPIYLIGGENTISKEVEAQLIKEMNAEIVRLAGNDRYETSIKIAEELEAVAPAGVNTTKEAFVVGGDGLADAMSIAAVAANKVAPIIVTPAAGLTRDAKSFLDDDTRDIATVNVVGGITKVSTKVMKDINEIKNTPASGTATAIGVDRISGNDRNDTNAEVLAKYFKNAGDLTNVYVAKDADSQLVDALAAAPLAGETNKGAIVLATNDLTKAQETAVKTAKHSIASKNETTQIGNGVASTVMQKVLKALGK